MTTYNTGNPLGSAAAKDLYDNAQNMDHRENDRVNEYWDDRFGVSRYTWYGIEKQNERAIAQYGWSLVDSFQEGATLTVITQALRWKLPDGDGEFYRWNGDLPVTIPAGSTPASTGGIYDPVNNPSGKWVGVGDSALRGQITDPNGATDYPELQIARWRDEGDARGWGVFPNGTDVTAKMCTWLDAVNGDYSKLVQYGQYRYRAYLPPGDYVVSTANLTGNHALLGRFILRSDLMCEGRIPNAEFVVLHVKGNYIRGLSCKNIIFQGVQHLTVDNIDTTGDITLKGSISTLPVPGLVSWGGGSYWNSFTRVKAGNTSGGGVFYLNIYEGSVNHNTFTQTSCAGIKIIGVRDGAESYENTFVNLDTAGTIDYVLDNQTSVNQKNNVIGLHCEVTGNGAVRGNWHILSYRVQYGNMASTMSHMNGIIGSDYKANQQGGDYLSMSGVNLCPTGDWSIINNSGFPIDYGNNNVIPAEFQLFSDSNEPSGAGRCYGISNASARARIYVNLTRTLTGYIRGAFYFRGDTPIEITIESTDGLEVNTFYQDPSKFFQMANSWKLYRVAAPTLDVTKTYRLRITVDAGKTGLIGGSYFSSYNTSVLPTFCGWSKASGRHNTTPTYSIPPIGFIYYRNSATAYPADPVYAWVHRGSGIYASLNVSS